MLPSYLISEAHRHLLVGELCISYGREGPTVGGKCEPDYLIVEPYRGTFLSRSQADFFKAPGGIEFVDFYVVDRFGLKRYRLLRRRDRASLRHIHEIDLFTGFIKSGVYRDVERAFENYVREYTSTCIFGCLASLALAGISKIDEITDGLESRGKIYHTSGLALYVDLKARSNAIVEVVASAPKVDAFRRIVFRLFEEASGVHWAYMGRLTVLSPSLLLDIFMSRRPRSQLLPSSSPR
ncbi:MAG: hypothetical protein QXP98_10090 [Thermoproteus sp.]